MSDGKIPTTIGANGIIFVIKDKYPPGIDIYKTVLDFAEIVDMKETIMRNRSIVDQAKNEIPQAIETPQILEKESKNQKHFDEYKAMVFKFFEYVGCKPFDAALFIKFIYVMEDKHSHAIARTEALRYLDYMIDTKVVSEIKEGSRVKYKFANNFSTLKDIKTIKDTNTTEKINITEKETNNEVQQYNGRIYFKVEGMGYAHIYTDYYKVIFSTVKYSQFASRDVRECFAKYSYDNNNSKYSVYSAKHVLRYYMAFAIKIGLVKRYGSGSATKYKFIANPNTFPFTNVRID